MRIALVQQHAGPDPAENRRRGLAAVREAAARGAQAVFIPQAGSVGEWPEGLYEAEMRVAAFHHGYITGGGYPAGDPRYWSFRPVYRRGLRSSNPPINRRLTSKWKDSTGANCQNSSSCTVPVIRS